MLEYLLNMMGEPLFGALIGAFTGLVFGISAQRSAFCLRAATVEFGRGSLGPKVAVWLLTFSTAVIWVQAAQLAGLFDAQQSRIMATTGSWSGAILGGLMTGAGMVLARGCSGRLLVLAATGNLRSVISGLVFALVAQMSLHGWLSGLRTWIAGLWITPNGQNLNLLSLLGLPQQAGIVFGGAVAALAIVLALRHKIGTSALVFASGVGFAVALGWGLTYALSLAAFDPVVVTSATFSGPSANTLMFFLTTEEALSFDIGLVPGVFLGAFVAAALKREVTLQGFEGESQMRRLLTGAALMGFGAMLAGGCAIGAGVTGGSIFAATAWAALAAMWAGAIVTDRLFDAPRAA